MRGSWRAVVVLIVVLGVVAGGLIVGRVPGAEQRATDDALEQAARVARSSYVYASSYNGDQLPTNAEVADHLAAGPGVVSVLARTVHRDDRRAVGTLATVDAVLIGEGSGFAVVPQPPQEVRVCVRFTLVHAESGPREIRHEARPCPPEAR